MSKAVLLASLVWLLALSAVVAADADGKKMEVKGKLNTGIAAIGGETTGIVLQTDQGTFELNLKSKELREKAAKLNGRMVAVTGTLQVRQGVEVKVRKIIIVNTLEEADK